MQKPRFNWVGWALLAAAGIVITLLAYAPAHDAGFYFDDDPNIVELPALHWTTLSLDGFREVVSGGRLPRRWVANTTFALNHVAGRLDPAGYHRVNILIHLAVGAALAWVACLYARRGLSPETRSSLPIAATASSLLFLLHPLNIQAVTYVVQRMTSLAALFCICAFGCYLRGRRASTRSRSIGFHALAVVTWVLALGSKENALILPLVIAAYELAFYRRLWAERIRSLAGGGRRWILFASVAAIAIAAYWVYVSYLDSPLPVWREVISGRDFTGAERVLTQTRVQFFYLGLLFWPAPSRLNLEHDFVVSRSMLDPPSTAVALAAWLIVFAAAVYLTRKRPRYGFPVMAYLLFHAIESGPFNLELVFEHRMYLPMAALVLLMTVGIVDLGKRRRAAALLAMLALALPLAMATHRRNVVWSDNLAFHYDCARKSPGKYRPQYNVGVELAEVGRPAEALPFFLKAVELRPESGKAHYHVGTAYLGLNRPDLALPELRLAVSLAPDHAYARFNLGLLLDNLRRGQEAVQHFERFLAIPAPKLAHLRPWVERRLLELAEVRSLRTPTPATEPGSSTPG